MIRNTKDTNVKLKKGGVSKEHLVVGSMDVAALYPNLDHETSTKIVREDRGRVN